MLMIRVELWPHGEHQLARTLATLRIWNDGTGTADVGNYKFNCHIAPSSWGPEEMREGAVTKHDRKLSVWTLIGKAIRKAGYYR